MDFRRPLKRALPKLGPPDIYPQDPKQKEDELTSMNVKQGYSSAPLISGPNSFDEFGTAKNADISASGCYISALLNEKHRINTLKDTQKKKQLVNTKEIWYVHAKTKHAVDNWFRDLANGTKSLGQLGKRIPIFNSKEGMFAQLYESHVPLAKAVWFIKMSAVHAIALSESGSKSKKRQLPDQYQELTAALIKYLKEISIRLSECYQQYQHHTQQQQQQHQQQQPQTQPQSQQHQQPPNTMLQQSQQTGLPNSIITSAQSILQQRNNLSSKHNFYNQHNLLTDINHSNLSCTSALLNHQPKLTANLHTSVATIMTSHTSSVASISATTITSLSMHEEFLPTYSQWQYQTQLARYLFDEGLLDQYDFLCFLLELIEKKRPVNDLLVKVFCPIILEYVIDFSKSAVLSRRLAHVCAKKLCQALYHQPQENNENSNNLSNNLYKNAIYMLSSILQVICIECPTAMVRHHGFQGSPLDHLPCLPSNLPMMESDLNFELRKSVHDAEREILLRSTMADSKWSCDSSSKVENFKAGLVNRLLTVLEILDRHNYDKIDSSNSIDILYQKIFPSSETDSVGVDEHVIKLLCEWATTTQRTGEHRALVVARLFEKRQSIELSKSLPTSTSKKQDDLKVSLESETEEYIQFSLQNLLVQFLDENAPYIDDNLSGSSDEKRKAFNNLVLLFSELIRCDVFSHYSYMCTLISRGMFNDLSTPTNVDSPAPGSNAPSSVKQPRSIGRDSDSILANTFQGLSSNSSMYPLSVATNTVTNATDPSSRSLGFSPVLSQNVSQNMDKSHGLLDNHMDDVDADLGKILQNINEGQQDEQVDILLPDFTSGSRDENSSKNKLSPFGLSDRTPSLENPASNHQANPLPVNSFGISDSKTINPPVSNSSSKNPSEIRHMIFVKHFPVPDDDNFIQDLNQRNFLLYGFGKEREDARHTLKKLNKEICKLFSRRASRDINDGGKVSKKLATRDNFNPEATLHKFESLSHHDQHVITNSLSVTIIEMFSGVSNGQTSLLPTLESMSFVFDMFSMASNVSGLLDLIVPILEELPDVEAQIKLKCPMLTNQYTHSIALCIIGMLYRYHSSVLLLSNDDITLIFESFYKLVLHVINPSICSTSAERVILCYLYDLYSSQTGKLFDQYSGTMQRIKLGILQTTPTMAYNCGEYEWQPTFLNQMITQLRQSHLFSNSITNPILNAASGPPSSSFTSVSANDLAATIRQQLYLFDSPGLRQLNEIPAMRFRFVCDAILLSATATYSDLVNDIAVLCADVTSKCPLLVNEWILALQALCCPAQRESGYRQLLGKINVADPHVMDNIAIFTAILVARRCMQLSVFILDCAIGAILAPLSSVDKSLTEPGARLTCHLLLTLFKNRDHPFNQTKLNQSTVLTPPNSFGQSFSNYGGNTPNYNNILGQTPNLGLLQAIHKEQDSGLKCSLNLKYLCDHHLLRSACIGIKTECHITLLKAIRVLAMWANPINEQEVPGRIKTEPHFDDINSDCLNLTSKGNSPRTNNLDAKHINLQTASLHQFADAILSLLCSQRWLHDKCLFDCEIFTDIDKNILLDPRIDVKQSQRLLYMICYNKSPEKQVDVGLDEQGSDQVASIVKMFENLDVWSMRLSLMRLQFMFAYCKSQSNVMLNDWLDNLAKAVVDFFQKASDSDIDISISQSITKINKVWLIEPLLEKLSKSPSAVQSKIIKASAALMESASVRANSLPSLNQTYLSTAAASTKFKERTLSQRGSASTNPSNLASTSLLGFQPFLSLLLSCLRNQDKERETLLTSLNSQLYQAIHEKVDDIGYKQSIQDGLELRLCLIGQMFDTIQKSSSLTSDWATLLLLLIMNNLVDPQIDYGLYVSVLDMLAILIHAAYASDPVEQKEDAKKQYQNLMKKFRKELTALEDKGFLQMRLINPLMPLVRQMTEVVTCEPMGSLVDTKGEKVENFFSIDKKRGLKVSELQEVSPWELIEGHKNPAPLSWPWFGAIRLDNKPLRSEENNRLMSWHTHNVRHTTAYFCQVPNVDEGPSSAKRSNSEKRLSQSNPLLKSLIEANDDSISRKENEICGSTASDEEDNFTGREDLLEDYCELPVDQLFDPTPIELMIEDIKTAMQAEQAALTARVKAQNVETKPVTHQASSILAPVQPIATATPTPPPAQMGLSPIVPATPNPPPPQIAMSPMVAATPTPPPAQIALSPMVAATPTPPPPKPRPPRKKRQTKKDTLVTNNQPVPMQIHQMPQPPPNQGMIIRRGPMVQPPQPPQVAQVQQQQQQASVYDFQAYQPPPPPPPSAQQQQQQQPMMSGYYQHHQSHPMQNQQQPQQHPHHHIQYQHPNQMQTQHHQHQHQQTMWFQHPQQQQQQQQQQIFAPQQAAGHSRPALTAMLHQKHAAAGNMENKMHPPQRFNFG